MILPDNTYDGASAGGGTTGRALFHRLFYRFSGRKRTRDKIASIRAALARADIDHARLLLTAELATRPADFSLLVEAARIEILCRHWPDAIRRWTQILGVAPKWSVAWSSLAGALRQSGEVERAQAILMEALRRFPHDAPLHAEAARLAEHRADFALAIDEWTIACCGEQWRMEWRHLLANALYLARRFDEAQALVDLALARRQELAPTIAENFVGLDVQIAAARRDAQLDRTLQGIAQADEGSNGDIREPVVVGSVEDEKTRRLLLGFESLGESCEFGLVQRRYGAEPLGLFRWNTVTSQALIGTLSENFEGLGSDETTELAMTDHREFTLRDRRWGFDMHTFIFEGQIDPARLREQMRRRVKFLRDKLIEDLTTGQKVFVYVTAGLDSAAIDRLAAALRIYGPTRLLVAQPSNGVPGDVTRIADNVVLGHLSRLGQSPDGRWDIAFDDWLSVCEKAAVVMTCSGA